MRAVLSGLLAAGALMLAAPTSSADLVHPKSASAFRDSVGVSTHIVYYDTAYGDWAKVVARVEELGVRHVRDGVYGNPSAPWRDWNERYYHAVELAAARGIRFAFGMGRPGNKAGTLDQLIGVVAGRLRHAAEALEAPNEFDHYVGGRRWPDRLAAYNRALYRKAKSHPSLRSLPVVGPSFATADGPRLLGDQRPWLDAGNIHPYTGGLSPDPRHLRSEFARASVTAGRKPVWATEAGFHNATRAAGGQPPVSEQAGAVYLLRTFLEHFASGIERTYAYELVDQFPDPARRTADHHFGLLRYDFSPKPAFTALRNLLALVGPAGGRPPMRPLRMTVSGDRGQVRRLVLQRSDGTYLVALWRLASVWDREERRALPVAPRPVEIGLPGAESVRVADPIRSAAARGLRLRRASVRLKLGGRPLVLEVSAERARD
jgi:hypothetical protein